MIKYVKGDFIIRDSFEKNVNQRGLGSHRPHGTGAELNRLLLNVVCYRKDKGHHFLEMIRMRYGSQGA
jgi:hypothetical protein